MMELKDIQELVRLINKTNISEFKLKEGDFSIAIRTKNYSEQTVITQPSIIPMPTAPVAGYLQAPMSAPEPTSAPASTPSSTPAAPAATASSSSIVVKSPMVGTFYRKPAPDKPLFVNVGDVVSVGDKLCVIEAMKLFNEIEAEVAGKVVRILVDDATPVEYDQPLFEIEPLS